MHACAIPVQFDTFLQNVCSNICLFVGLTQVEQTVVREKNAFVEVFTLNSIEISLPPCVNTTV